MKKIIDEYSNLNPEIGLWLDFHCHIAVEVSEKKELEIPFYNFLKQILEDENL